METLKDPILLPPCLPDLVHSLFALVAGYFGCRTQRLEALRSVESSAAMIVLAVHTAEALKSMHVWKVEPVLCGCSIS